jgi:predicted amidohydrolase YtcJ
VEIGKTSPADLLKAKVRYTIVGGRIVHDATRSTRMNGL